MDKETLESGSAFEPRMIGFVCNWGAYSALEMAGVEKRKYSPNISFIRLMCLGRIHPGLILKSFELGADGVLLLGCPSGSCHYQFGVDRTKDSMESIHQLMDILGLGSRRLRLVEVPAGDSEFLAHEINRFERRIRKAGPSPVRHLQSLTGAKQIPVELA